MKAPFTAEQLDTLEEYLLNRIDEWGYSQTASPRKLSAATLKLRWQLCREAPRDLHLLNTTIIPRVAGVWGSMKWEIQEVEVLRAKELLRDAQSITSHVGHESTAALLSTLLDMPVAYDRTPWDGTGLGLAFQVHGRPPEGEIMDLAALNKMGYSLRFLWRVA